MANALEKSDRNDGRQEIENRKEGAVGVGRQGSQLEEGVAGCWFDVSERKAERPATLGQPMQDVIDRQHRHNPLRGEQFTDSWRACEGNLEAHGQNRFTGASTQG